MVITKNISMNIGQKHNRRLLTAMDKIYDLSLLTKKNDPIRYWVEYNPMVIDSNYQKPEVEIGILEKLEEMGLIKIINPGGTGEYE